MLSLRVAGPQDADLVSDILTDSYPAGMASHYPQEILQAVLPTVARAHPTHFSSGTYFVASFEERAVGCGGWSVEPPSPKLSRPRCAYARQFAVRPSHMRMGVGKAIFRRCAFEVAMAGFDSMRVESALNAEGFYASVGFRAYEQSVETINGVPFALVHMERAI